MQQVLIVTTKGGNFRSEVVGWGGEDPTLYVPNKPIGLTPGLMHQCYNTVLEAMADNWHLLGPPTLSDELGDQREKYYSWYLVREVNAKT